MTINLGLEFWVSLLIAILSMFGITIPDAQAQDCNYVAMTFEQETPNSPDVAIYMEPYGAAEWAYVEAVMLMLDGFDDSLGEMPLIDVAAEWTALVSDIGSRRMEQWFVEQWQAWFAFSEAIVITERTCVAWIHLAYPAHYDPPREFQILPNSRIRCNSATHTNYWYWPILHPGEPVVLTTDYPYGACIWRDRCTQEQEYVCGHLWSGEWQGAESECPLGACETYWHTPSMYECELTTYEDCEYRRWGGNGSMCPLDNQQSPTSVVHSVTDADRTLSDEL